MRVTGNSQRSFLKDRPLMLDYQEGLAQVREYIEKGVQNPRKDKGWEKARRWLHKQRKMMMESTKKSANEQCDEKTRSDVATKEV